MDLWNIVKTVGSGIISAVVPVPGGPLIVGAINKFLPDDAKLPENATGQQAQDAIATIPAEQRAALMDKQFDVEITQIKESHDTVRAMLTADAAMPQTTRPYIAKHSFHVIAIVILITIGTWAYGIWKAPAEDIVAQVVNGWPFVLAVAGPLVVLLHAYFGILKSEQKNKLDASNGQSQPAGIAGILSLLKGK